MEELIIKTGTDRQIIDITDQVGYWLRSTNGGSGLLNLFIAHTTAALTTADLDPGTDSDMLDAFETMIPKLNYRHPHDPGHVSEHILASLIGPSVSIPVRAGQLRLGAWQRIILVEFSGPRERKIFLSLID